MKLRGSQCIEHAEKCLQTFKSAKAPLDRLWHMLVLFYRGEQWITYDTSISLIRRTNLRRTVPRPVTNKFAAICNSLIAELLQFDPRIVIAPQTDNYNDLMTAKIGNQIIKVIENETNRLLTKTELIPWVVLTGNAFEILGFDSEKGVLQTSFLYSCPQCGFTTTVQTSSEDETPTSDVGECPNCAQANLQIPLVLARDEDGHPLKTYSLSGRMSSEVVSPFEMFLDYRIPHIEDQHTIIRIHRKDKRYLETRYPKKKILENTRSELPAHILNNLASLAVLGMQFSEEQAVDVVEVWHKPSKDFEKGFYLLYTTPSPEGILELQEYPFITKEGHAFYPIIHYLYERVPGTFLGRTPAFDLLEKQRVRNRVEALIEMIIMRMANPVWLEPKPGTETPITGHVGQIIQYNPHLTNGAKPERLEGSSVNPAIVQYLYQIDLDMRALAGLNELQMGERPKSIKSGYGLQRLEQASEDRRASTLMNWALSEARWQKVALEIFRIVSPPGRYYRILGETATWSVRKLQEADLAGGVDIWAEPGGTIPKTHLERLATLETLIQLGFLNPQDPMTRVRVFREYGQQKLIPEVDVDEAYVSREHDRFLHDKPIMVSPFDNHALHLQRHLELYKSEEFEEIPFPKKEMFIRHILEHQQAYLQQIQQAQQIQPQGFGQPPSGQPPPGG